MWESFLVMFDSHYENSQIFEFVLHWMRNNTQCVHKTAKFLKVSQDRKNNFQWKTSAIFS